MNRSFAKTALRLLLSRTAIVIALFFIAVCAIAIQASGTLDWLIEQETRLRTFQQKSPIATFVVSMILYFIACFIPGTNGKAVITGWLMGIVLGALVINIASTLGALAMFTAGRRFMRKSIESRYARQIQQLNERFDSHSGYQLLTLRLIPFMPYAPVNLLVSVMPIRPTSFWWATQLGLLPSSLAFAWLGSNLPQMSAVRDLAWHDVLTVELLIAVIVVACLPLLFSHVNCRVRRKFSHRSS